MQWHSERRDTGIFLWLRKISKAASCAFTALGLDWGKSILSRGAFTAFEIRGVGGCGGQGCTPADDYLRSSQWVQSGLLESLWQTDQGAGWSFYLSKEDFHPAFSFECRLARAETF